MGGYVRHGDERKLRLTVIQPGEEVWSKEVPLEGIGILAVGFHILNAIMGGGELVIKPNRTLSKAEMDQLREFAE